MTNRHVTVPGWVPTRLETTFDVEWARGVLAEADTPADRNIQQIQDLRAASGQVLTTNEAKALAEQVNAGRVAGRSEVTKGHDIRLDPNPAGVSNLELFTRPTGGGDSIASDAETDVSLAGRTVFVDFDGGQVAVVLVGGEPYPILNMACRDLGLDWKSQYAKVKADPAICMVENTTQLPGDGQSRTVMTTDLDGFVLWLGEKRNGAAKTRLTARGMEKLAEHFEITLDLDRLADAIAVEQSQRQAGDAA